MPPRSRGGPTPSWIARGAASRCPRSPARTARCSAARNAAELWVGDVADLNKILLHANLPALSAIGGYVNPDEMTGMCPACNVDLVVVEGGGEALDRRATTPASRAAASGSTATRTSPRREIDWKDAEGQIVGFFRRFAKKK